MEIDILATLEENFKNAPPPLTNSWIRACQVYKFDVIVVARM